MKGHITTTATGTTRGFASLPTASGKTAKSMPQNVLPTSPMKTRAGGQFHMRNPSDAAAKAAATAPIAVAPEIHAAAAIAIPAASPVIPAIPSMPSMKLKALMSPTIQRTVSGQAAMPRSNPPNDPRSTRSTGPKTAVAATAAAICTKNLTRIGTGFRSSNQLTAATASAGSTAPANEKSDSGWSTAASRAAADTTATIASPPPRGVGNAWLPRSFGRSSMPRAFAQSISCRVSTAEPNTAVSDHTV